MTTRDAKGALRSALTIIPSLAKRWRTDYESIPVTSPATLRQLRSLLRSPSLPASSRMPSFTPDAPRKPPSSAFHRPLFPLLGRDLSLRWIKKAFNRFSPGRQGVASDRAGLSAPFALKQKLSSSEYRSQIEEGHC